MGREVLTITYGKHVPIMGPAPSRGSKDFHDDAARTTAYRQQMDHYEILGHPGGKAWAAYEPGISYNTDSNPKSGF